MNQNPEKSDKDSLEKINNKTFSSTISPQETIPNTNSTNNARTSTNNIQTNWNMNYLCSKIKQMNFASIKNAIFNKNNLDNDLFCYGVFNGIIPFIFYPFYRIFLEHKIYGMLNFPEAGKNFIPKFSQIKESVKIRNGFFSGFGSYYIQLLACIPSKIIFNDDNSVYYNLAGALVTYPFFYSLLLQSNKKALKSSCYYPILKSRENLIKFIFNKESYKGISLNFLNELIFMNLPLLNFFFCYKIDSIRITYVFGTNSNGLNFKSLIEAKNFAYDNKSIYSGRFSYNVFLIFYNLYLFNFIRLNLNKS